MNETKSVDEAINRGHWTVTYPGMMVMFLTMGLSIYFGTYGYLPKWTIPVGFILSFVLSWLYWSFMITKWRIWSLENVRNVHELKKRAIQEKLIWNDGNFFEKTEIRKAPDKEKLKSLQSKFKETDIFKDDKAIPKETIIYYSKGKNFFEMVIMLAGFFAGIYILTTSESYYWGIGLIIVCGYLAFKEYKEATNREPQIIINEKGIKTISTQHYPWAEIRNEEVISEGYGKHTKYYLTYDFPNGNEKLQIDEYETQQRELENLMRIYRGRNSNYR